jgi:hypothetical protein
MRWLPVWRPPPTPRATSPTPTVAVFAAQPFDSAIAEKFTSCLHDAPLDCAWVLDLDNFCATLVPRRNSDPGPDGIFNICGANGPLVIQTCFYNLYRFVLELGQLPPALNYHALFVFVPKTDHDDDAPLHILRAAEVMSPLSHSNSDAKSLLLLLLTFSTTSPHSTFTPTKEVESKADNS